MPDEVKSVVKGVTMTALLFVMTVLCLIVLSVGIR